tara:strand:+ start:13978 stop:14763 length:786 start_codon:yes stop_codon:yes gene_type:complete
MRIALCIEYNGTRYFGWQAQTTKSKNTIQYHIDLAISNISNEKITSICAGRTDTGVHAINQIIHFDTLSKRKDNNWINGINALLPNDIKVKKIFHVDNTFHARFSAISRKYRYIIYNDILMPTFFNNLVYHYKEKLNIQNIRKSSKFLLGKHDFSSFRSSGCQSNSPIRTIKKIEVKKIKKFLIIDIIADSFLYHMVRNIVGTLLDIGTDKYTSTHMKNLILMKDRSKASKMISASGLYLFNVNYSKKYNINVNNNDFYLC